MSTENEGTDLVGGIGWVGLPSDANTLDDLGIDEGVLDHMFLFTCIHEGKSILFAVPKSCKAIRAMRECLDAAEQMMISGE